MNGNELIAALQKLTPEQRQLPVYIRLPSDDFSEADTPTVASRNVRGWSREYQDIIEL